MNQILKYSLITIGTVGVVLGGIYIYKQYTKPPQGKGTVDADAKEKPVVFTKINP